MSIWRLVPAAAVLLICSCDFASHRTAMRQGCYYYGNTPIFKIVRDRGFLKIPGDIKTFDVEVYGNDHTAEVVFSPGFLLNSDPSNAALINMKYGDGRDQRQTVTAISTDPHIRINWAAYGDAPLHPGKPC